MAGPEPGARAQVAELLAEARANSVQVVFALSRNRLAKALHKSMRMSAATVHLVSRLGQAPGTLPPSWGASTSVQ